MDKWINKLLIGFGCLIVILGVVDVLSQFGFMSEMINSFHWTQVNVTDVASGFALTSCIGLVCITAGKIPLSYCKLKQTNSIRIKLLHNALLAVPWILISLSLLVAITNSSISFPSLKYYFFDTAAFARVIFYLCVDIGLALLCLRAAQFLSISSTPPNINLEV